jgi:hypothetical protein
MPGVFLPAVGSRYRSPPDHLAPVRSPVVRHDHVTDGRATGSRLEARHAGLKRPMPVVRVRPGESRVRGGRFDFGDELVTIWPVCRRGREKKLRLSCVVNFEFHGPPFVWCPRSGKRPGHRPHFASGDGGGNAGGECPRLRFTSLRVGGPRKPRDRRFRRQSLR